MMALDGARRRFDGTARCLLLWCCCLRRPPEKCSKPLAAGDVAPLRVRTELARVHAPRPPPAISPCGQGARLGHRAAGYRAAN
jgi:hypothetical protein